CWLWQCFSTSQSNCTHIPSRSSSNNFHAFDLETNKTLHRLRKVRSTEVSDSSSFILVSDSVNNTFTSNPTNNSDFSEFSSVDTNSISDIVVNTSDEPEQMENNDRTLKELATSDLKPTQFYELKSGLIHLLPKFHSLVGENMHKHLKEFHMVCSTMRPHGIPENGATKDWLYL
ncbi:hypothetical protein CR513_48953, partial [Mucuna pruriens]